MRILFLTHYFPPEVNAPASRTYEHCRIWVRDGHEVAVLTNVPNHPAGKVYPGHRNGICRTETVGGIRVYRLLTFLAPNRGVVRRTVNYVFYLLMAILAAPFVRRADVVVSTSPQFFCGLAGYFVSRIHRAPWVLEIRDLWPESIVAVGAVRGGLAVRAVVALVNFCYRKADRIVCVTDAFKAAIAAEGIPEDKIEVIKNGVDLEFFAPGAKPPVAPAGLPDLHGKFVAAYVGTHGMAHGLHTVLEAAELLRDRPDVVFLLVGDGAEREALLRRRDALGLDNVIMLEQQPKSAMPAIWAATSLSLVLLRDQPLFRTVIPSKIFESFGMGKPVILGVRGESQALVEQSGGGICIQPESAIELAAAVRRLHDQPADARRLGAAGRLFVEEHFDRQVLARRFQSLLESLTAGRAGVAPAGPG